MKVLGMGNQDEFNYLIIKKEEGFFEWLNKFLTKGFGGSTIDVMYYEDREVGGKIVNSKRKVKGEIDLHEFFDTNEGLRVNLFYGKEKIFLTFAVSLEKRKKIMEVLEKISDFEE